MPDYSNVTREHVLMAIRDVLRDGVPTGRLPTKYVLVVGSDHLPPKYTLGLAYQHATGDRLTPNQFSGGAESNSVLSRLGFDVRLKRDPRRTWNAEGLVREYTPPQPSPTSARLPPARPSARLIPALRVASIGLRKDLGPQRASAVVRALDRCFFDWKGDRLALLPGVTELRNGRALDAVDGNAWAQAVQTAARAIGAIVLFETTDSRAGRRYRAYDGTADRSLFDVEQIFATSAEADADHSLVDRVLARSRSGGSGSASMAGRTVGLLVCGENNVLRNAQSADNAVSVRHYPERDLFEHAEIVCNGAHTVMGNWGKLDRRFEYLSRGNRVALYATNLDSGSWRSSCRVYVDGRRVATGAAIDAAVRNARLVNDPSDMFCAVSVDLDSRAAGRQK